MLFMITQEHGPESCPRDEGGSDVLINKNAKGITLKGRWGAWTHHKIWYLIEADNFDAIQSFLEPGMKRCTCMIEPVGEQPVKR